MRHVITRFQVLFYALIIAASLAVVQSTFAQTTPPPTGSREASFQDSTSELSLEALSSGKEQTLNQMQSFSICGRARHWFDGRLWRLRRDALHPNR